MSQQQADATQSVADSECEWRQSDGRASYRCRSRCRWSCGHVCGARVARQAAARALHLPGGGARAQRPQSAAAGAGERHLSGGLAAPVAHLPRLHVVQRVVVVQLDLHHLLNLLILFLIHLRGPERLSAASDSAAVRHSDAEAEPNQNALEEKQRQQQVLLALLHMSCRFYCLERNRRLFRALLPVAVFSPS